jgi:hypothetical protein
MELINARAIDREAVLTQWLLHRADERATCQAGMHVIDGSARLFERSDIRDDG